MPIKGLTDRNLSFPEIGQIRKGGKKEGNAPGKDLEYFRVEFDEREKEAIDTFRRIYGDKPTEINIVLPFNEIDRMWDAWLEAYTAGRMVARSDGEKFTYLVDVQTGKILVKGGIDIQSGQPRPYIDGKAVGFWINRNKNNQQEPITCKPTGRLKVVIPELGRAAYLTVMTTSVHDIANISAQLQAFQQVNGGRIAGIPLVLRRRPKMISTPNQDGTRARRKKWMLSIEADPEWVKKMLLHVKKLALPGNGLALLPEGDRLEEPDENDQDFDNYPDEGEIEEGLYSEPEMPGDDLQGVPTGPEATLTPLQEMELRFGLTLAEAGAMQSRSGKTYFSASDDQLRQVLERNDPSTKWHQAAQIILESRKATPAQKPLI